MLLLGTLIAAAWLSMTVLIVAAANMAARGDRALAQSSEEWLSDAEKQRWGSGEEISIRRVGLQPATPDHVRHRP
jgi:hypothetical protein